MPSLRQGLFDGTFNSRSDFDQRLFANAAKPQRFNSYRNGASSQARCLYQLIGLKEAFYCPPPGKRRRFLALGISRVVGSAPALS